MQIMGMRAFMRTVPGATRAKVVHLLLSLFLAVFSFQIFLYAYCAQYRPRAPAADDGLIHPFNIKGRTVYVSLFESIFMNGFFFWIGALIIVLLIFKAFVRQEWRYDILKRRIVHEPVQERPSSWYLGVLMCLWLTMMLAGWLASA